MLCPRCISAVEKVFEGQLIEIRTIQLGEVTTVKNISESQKAALGEALIISGFELLENNKSKLIGRIKTIIIDQIHHQPQQLKINFSSYLAEKLNQEYTSLSRLFSSVEGITIERFILKHKIERVKEFLFYKEHTLSEIAFKMDYSSVAHLSAQFKKETGMTPTEFKKIRKPSHNSLDSL